MSKITPTFLSFAEVMEIKNQLNGPKSQQSRKAIITWMSVNNIKPVGDGTKRFKYSAAKVQAAIDNLKKQA